MQVCELSYERNKLLCLTIVERDGGILVGFGKVGLNILDEDSLHSANKKILLVKAKISKPELRASKFQVA